MIITIQQNYPYTSTRSSIKLVVKKKALRYSPRKTMTNNTFKRFDEIARSTTSDACTHLYLCLYKDMYNACRSGLLPKIFLIYTSNFTFNIGHECKGHIQIFRTKLVGIFLSGKKTYS